jgi:hypothetical protein
LRQLGEQDRKPVALGFERATDFIDTCIDMAQRLAMPIGQRIDGFDQPAQLARTFHR